MTKILIITHAQLGKSFVESAKMLGSNLEDVSSISFDETMGIEQLEEQINDYLEKNHEDILIFTDIIGGSPFNVASLLTHEKENVAVFYGVNLPIFIETLSQKNTLTFEALVDSLNDNKNLSLGFGNL
ncbi:PTS sugar transporter subunit IIA [Isobaculum melis]|uniref:PTS system, N-acetylgalactosamine-specific IIA component n=1 Tax=Isobaculum melis TaxID=142588 RepID=A0A1H9T319_9LACT|nr:PTS sugar transporter subunit IIA [Isobaculum melis]SER91139.1 PTS system, N-acetylgalactosamine-specific IIA component [Isobaculum melis]